MSDVAAPSVDQWDEHWDDFGDANEHNPAQQYRQRLVVYLLGRGGTPDRLLDIGSGNGELLAAAARRWPAARLAGLELSPSAVADSQRKVPQARIRVCDLLREPAPEPDETAWATHAACSEVLEHVDDPVTLLRNSRQWLAPGCRVVVTVPGGPMSAFDRHIGHRRHFTPGQLGEVMNEAGLDVGLVAGAGFPAFNLYRGLVIARGERLIADAAPGSKRSAGGLVIRGAMAAFKPLLLLSLPRSRYGWQTIGVAHNPWDR